MKKTLIASLLTLGLFGSSCLGPDRLYNNVKNWNTQVSEEDWLNEAIYIGFFILPVYPAALFGDVVIFNTIGYWTGGNPIRDPGPFPGFDKKQ